MTREEKIQDEVQLSLITEKRSFPKEGEVEGWLFSTENGDKQYKVGWDSGMINTTVWDSNGDCILGRESQSVADAFKVLFDEYPEARPSAYVALATLA